MDSGPEINTHGSKNAYQILKKIGCRSRCAFSYLSKCAAFDCTKHHSGVMAYLHLSGSFQIRIGIFRDFSQRFRELCFHKNLRR